MSFVLLVIASVPGLITAGGPSCSPTESCSQTESRSAAGPVTSSGRWLHTDTCSHVQHTRGTLSSLLIVLTLGGDACCCCSPVSYAPSTSRRNLAFTPSTCLSCFLHIDSELAENDIGSADKNWLMSYPYLRHYTVMNLAHPGQGTRTATFIPSPHPPTCPCASFPWGTSPVHRSYR